MLDARVTRPGSRRWRSKHRWISRTQSSSARTPPRIQSGDASPGPESRSPSSTQPARAAGSRAALSSSPSATIACGQHVPSHSSPSGHSGYPSSHSSPSHPPLWKPTRLLGAALRHLGPRERRQKGSYTQTSPPRDTLTGGGPATITKHGSQITVTGYDDQLNDGDESRTLSDASLVEKDGDGKPITSRTSRSTSSATTSRRRRATPALAPSPQAGPARRATPPVASSGGIASASLRRPVRQP